MLRKLAMPVAVVLTFAAYPVAGDEKGKSAMLADVVKEFNQRAKQNATGKDQPALTEDEIIAAIRAGIEGGFRLPTACTPSTKGSPTPRYFRWARR